MPIAGMANRRGLNVVVIDISMGQILSAKTYDIWGNPVEENRRLAKDFRQIEEENVVLVALKDSGMENLDGEAPGSESKTSITYYIYNIIYI